MTVIREFRALGKQTPNAIPVIRSKCETFGEGEVWPLAAMKHGYGYIFITGMHMVDQSEHALFVRALNSFTEWFAKEYS